MTATYKLVRNPRPNPSDELQMIPLHPRLISCGTIHTDQLIETAKPRSSFSPADMKGVLQLLKDVMTDYLKAGYNVELDGIGIFSVSLQGQPVTHKEKIRSESIRFKNVNFRASKSLKEGLKTMAVYREKGKVHETSPASKEDGKRIVLDYLATSPFLTPREYERLCNCSKSKASIDLRDFVKEGVLSRKKIGNLYLYYRLDERVSSGDLLK